MICSTPTMPVDHRLAAIQSLHTWSEKSYNHIQIKIMRPMVLNGDSIPIHLQKYWISIIE